MNSRTTQINMVFEGEFFAAFPNAIEVHNQLHALYDAYLICDTCYDEYYQKVSRYTFAMMTNEQLKWIEEHTHKNTPYGEGCRIEIMERLLLDKVSK